MFYFYYKDSGNDFRSSESSVIRIILLSLFLLQLLHHKDCFFERVYTETVQKKGNCDLSILPLG